MTILRTPNRRAVASFVAVLVCLASANIAYHLVLPPLLMALKPEIEQRFARTQINEGDAIAGFIVPGGGDERIRGALELARRFPTARLILTGARYDEIAILKAVPDPTRRFVVEPHASTTFENAVYSKRIAQPRSGERWILVTTALHMPRAMGAFSAAGFHVEPWPVPMREIPRRYVEPMVAYEVAALAYYRLTGRSPAFFPGPDDVGLNSYSARKVARSLQSAVQ
ncbi:MAG: YdcF family protein [Hyphomicrobiaceae bacterium]|nr:YdcF family protein [Hyphomicrobiaceae bacterium]